MIEYFDERSTEFLRKDDGEPDMDRNHHYLACQQAYYNMLNDLKDVRLSEIYYALGIPFPDNYLIDYKLKKKELPFVFYYDKNLGKIKIDIAVPDQPILRDTGDALEYIFAFHKEE